MSHETDSIGLPVDPELRRLEFLLGDLAAQWREYESPERQNEIVLEYHSVMERLYELGWDGFLDWDSELPTELMPEQHPKQRHNS
ncbi:MAG TPA: hypothetical protein P5526_28295 [Anaerolineae bacterium]|nr:hypothetical protein [Anaerolineae bacterium]